jgi:hypothetical protein
MKRTELPPIPAHELTNDKRIVILTYGWVMIGNYNRKDDMATLTDASVIRRWGTDKGIGQIALNGPTKETLLDSIGMAEFPLSSVVSTIKCR